MSSEHRALGHTPLWQIILYCAVLRGRCCYCRLRIMLSIEQTNIIIIINIIIITFSILIIAP